jgi:hypothetical protein
MTTPLFWAFVFKGGWVPLLLPLVSALPDFLISNPHNVVLVRRDVVLVPREFV